jgi:hypothetical protein
LTHATFKWALPVLAAFAAGCATTGTGVGSGLSDSNTVTFDWRSSDSISGMMRATLSDGRTYSGQFLQITSDATVDNLSPFWVQMDPGWPLYDWTGGPEFLTHYSGNVLADLAAPDGARMHCRLKLAHPSSGMAGGGRGECQIPGGVPITATFPKT